MTETAYDLSDDDQVLALGQALVARRFDQRVEVEWADPASIRDMLSDIDWYASRWNSGTVDPHREVGFHPVAGRSGRWPTYMWRQGYVVHLVVA